MKLLLQLVKSTSDGFTFLKTKLINKKKESNRLSSCLPKYLHSPILLYKEIFAFVLLFSFLWGDPPIHNVYSVENN